MMGDAGSRGRSWKWGYDCGGDRVLSREHDRKAFVGECFAVAYPDGHGAAVITVNDEEVAESPRFEEATQAQAMAKCERWLDRRMDAVRSAVKEALTEENGNDDRRKPKPPTLDYIKEGEAEPEGGY